MSSSLLYVGISNHETPFKEFQQNDHKIVVEPERILFFIFQNEKTNIAKVQIRNDYPYKISFKVVQPKRSVLIVRCKKYSLHSKETLEVYVFFNPGKDKNSIEDEFLIILQKQKIKLHVPILCKSKQLRLSHSRRKSLNKKKDLEAKENLQQDSTIIKSTSKLSLKRRTMVKNQKNQGFEKMIASFQLRYKQISEFVKEKNVKKEIFIGQKDLTFEKLTEIKEFNIHLKEFIWSSMKNKIERRFVKEYSAQGPVVRNFEGLILRWAQNRNIPRITYEKGLAKIQEYVRKYLVDLRFQKVHKIFKIYKDFQNSKQHLNVPHQKRQQIYVEKLQKKLNKRRELNVELTFDKKSISPDFVSLQYESDSSKYQHSFEINPRIGFDNWVAIEESVPYYHQIMGYSKKQQISEWICYPKLKESTIIIDENFQDSSNSLSNKFEDTLFCSSEINDILDSLQEGGKKKYLKHEKEQQATKNSRLDSKADIENARISSKKLGVEGNVVIRQGANIPRESILKCTEFATILLEAHKNSQSSISSQNSLLKRQSSFIKQNHSYDDGMLIENYKTLNRLKTVSSPSEEKRFRALQQISKCLDFEPNQQFDFGSNEVRSRQSSMAINELQRHRYHMDLFNELIFARQHCEPYKEQLNVYQTERLYPFRNNLIYTVPKEDRHEFDRLNSRQLKILGWIQGYEANKDWVNGKIKGQVEIEVPAKNKNPGCSDELYERAFENLQNYKKFKLCRSSYLTIFLHQIAKNKVNAILYE